MYPVMVLRLAEPGVKVMLTKVPLLRVTVTAVGGSGISEVVMVNVDGLVGPVPN